MLIHSATSSETRLYIMRRNTAQLCQLTEYTADILDLYLPSTIYLQFTRTKELSPLHYSARGVIRCASTADLAKPFRMQTIRLRIDLKLGASNTGVDDQIASNADEVSA